MGKRLSKIHIRSIIKKHFILLYVHDDLAAEDIAAESLIALWEKMKESQIDYEIPLLLTILKNKSLDYLKHEAIKMTAYEAISDWKRQELSFRISLSELLGASCKKV